MSTPGKLNQAKALLAIGLLALAALGGGAWWASRERAQSASSDANAEPVNPGDAGGQGGPQRSGDDAPPETFADQRAWNAGDETAWNNAPHEPAQIALADTPWKRDMVKPAAPLQSTSVETTPVGPAAPAPPVAPVAPVPVVGLSDVASQRLWDPAQEALWQKTPHAVTTIALAQNPWTASPARLPATRPSPVTTRAASASRPAATTAPSGIPTMETQTQMR